MPGDRRAGGFFAIDHGAFRCAAAGGLNSAIAHLVMARGTGPDNRETQWSVNAIERYAGISRPNAKKAVEDLLNRGVWKKTRDGKHPIYEAVPGDQIPGGPFTVTEKAVIDAIRNGNKLSYETRAVFEALKARGIVTECEKRRANNQRYQSVGLDDAAIAALSAPSPVWLPNALIDAAANEVPPIELIRQTRSLTALRLLIELYAVQFLPNYGGVPREMLQVKFERLRVGECGSFVVWGFKRENIIGDRELARPFFTGELVAREDGHRWDSGWDSYFFPALDTLETLGLIEPVGMLLEGNDPDAEIIHPYGLNGGEPEERELARIAHEAATTLVTGAQIRRSQVTEYPHLAPVQRHIANVTLVEIYRLKYRPHTMATAAWYAQMKQNTGEWMARYRKIISDRANRQSAA